jgi:uncharacterized protein (TIGR02391 family)
MVRKPPTPPIESREFRSPEEIDAAVAKLRRRIEELKNLDVQSAILNHTGAERVAQSNIRETIRDVFGGNSPEFREHQNIDFWAGPMYMNMSARSIIECTKAGCVQVVGILNGLIGRLEEKRADLVRGTASSAPSTYFDRLNLHPRIIEVSRDRFVDGYPWDAVFASAKALVNYVKDRSGRHDLDGAPLMRAVFSKNDPVLTFNDLADQTDLDEQEGMMHLFEGAAQAIRNPGAHDFPEGSEQRAIEYISFLSLLAYRLQEAKVRKEGP